MSAKQPDLTKDNQIRMCGVPGCPSEAYQGSQWCQYHEAVNPFDDEGPPRETCKHCGKELEEFADLGCEYCDRRHPDFGVMP